MMRWLLAALLLVSLITVPACDKASPVAPAGTTITLSVNPTRINIAGQATVTAIVRRDNGSPVNPGTEINFSTSLGLIEPATVGTNDAGVAETTLSGAGQIGVATVTASTGAATPATAEVQIGSLASSMTLQASPTSVGPEGGEVDLLAVVRDDAGQLLENLAVNFSTTAGLLDSRGAALLTNELGQARDRLVVTDVDIVALGSDVVTVSAFAATGEGAALLEATTEVGIRGLISSISLQVTPGSVPLNGGDLELLALVKDDVGRGVAGAQVSFTAEAGSLDSGGAVISTNAAGQASDTLRVTGQDVDALGTRTFNVTAETVDNTGQRLIDTFTVRVQTGAPIADFDAFVNGRTVTFQNRSTGDQPLSFVWDFGDGTQPAYRFDSDPIHEYQDANTTYNVSLQVTNPIGTDTIIRSVTTGN